jgi:hypothetical protein
MWKTRDKDIASVQPREEMQRIFTLLSWILIYGVAIYWGASYCAPFENSRRIPRTMISNATSILRNARPNADPH